MRGFSVQLGKWVAAFNVSRLDFHRPSIGIRRAENFDAMSSEQLMLRDLIFEVPDLLREADKESRDYQAGVWQALGLLKHKLETFEIDQSRFAKQMPDVEGWFLRGEQ